MIGPSPLAGLRKASVFQCFGKFVFHRANIQTARLQALHHHWPNPGDHARLTWSVFLLQFVSELIISSVDGTVENCGTDHRGYESPACLHTSRVRLPLRPDKVARLCTGSVKPFYLVTR